MVYDSVPFTAFFGAANITIWLYQRRVGDLDHLVWPIKKISSTNPANIRCLLIIKVGHIGANNLFPNVMQIENYLFSSYLPYIQKREYIDGMALPYVGGDPSIAKGGSLKVISGHLYFRL